MTMCYEALRSYLVQKLLDNDQWVSDTMYKENCPYTADKLAMIIHRNGNVQKFLLDLSIWLTTIAGHEAEATITEFFRPNKNGLYTVDE